MRKSILMGFLFVSGISFAQSTIATTESGRRVLLKKNNTWEYIDGETKKDTKVIAEKGCDFGKDFIEVKANERLRKHVAVENDCKPEEIKFISMTQGLGNGMYTLCVKGKIMKYKKVGTVFMRAEQDPLKY